MKKIELGFYLMSQDRKQFNKILKEKGINAKMIFDGTIGEIIIKTKINGNDEEIKSQILSALNLKEPKTIIQ